MERSTLISFFILAWFIRKAASCPLVFVKITGTIPDAIKDLRRAILVAFSGSTQRLLLVALLLSFLVTLLGGLHLLTAYTAGAATAERRGQGEVNVLLRVETDHE